jgi:hypothetical protein
VLRHHELRREFAAERRHLLAREAAVSGSGWLLLWLRRAPSAGAGAGCVGAAGAAERFCAA